MGLLFCMLLATALLVFSPGTAQCGPVPGTLKWAYATGAGISSSPAIGPDGTIYVGSWDFRLYAIDPEGRLKWFYETGDAIDSSPAIGPDGTIYVGSWDFRLYAVSPDGTLKWSYFTGDRIRSSPAIGPDGTIYVGSGDYKLHAVNPNGTLKWAYATGRGIYSSPAIGRDGTVYVGSSDSKLYAVSPDGTLKWSYATESGMIHSSPAIGVDGTLYVGSLGGEFYAIGADGVLKWFRETGGRISASPAIGPDGTIYVGSGDYSFYFLRRSGTVKARLETMGVRFGSPPAIGADGTIYVGSSDGALRAIDPATGEDAVLYNTGGEISSSPAIGPDGTIYVGSLDGSLYAIHSASAGLAASPWPMFRHDLRRTGNLAPTVGSVTLEVIKSGGGLITSLPPGIDCGAACIASYRKGARVTLTPEPERGYIFGSWSGACKGKGACTVTMGTDKSVGGLFEEGQCTYTVSPKKRTLSYRGGTISLGITARGSLYCPSPDTSREGDWIGLGSLFSKNSGKAVITVPEYAGSVERSGSVSIGGATFRLIQKGRPCALTLGASSPGLFPREGGTGILTVEATPGDCTWTATTAGTSTWITITSGKTGKGTGNVVYEVGANAGPGERNGSIRILTFDKKSSTYVVRQSNK